MALPKPGTSLRSDSLAKMMPIVIGLAAVAYAAAAYFLLFLPKIGSLLEGGSLDLTAIEASLEEEKAYGKRLDEAVSSFKTLNPDRKERVAAIVPVEPDAPGIYVQMDTLARANGLALLSIDAVPDDRAVTPALRKTIRVAANVAGGNYQQFKLYLADVERSLRLFDVQGVIFTPSSASYGMIIRAYELDQARAVDPMFGAPVAAAPAAAVDVSP